MLTNKQYVEKQCCPFCGCRMLQYGQIDIGADSAYQEVRCGAVDCGKAWFDRYLLAGYEHKDNQSNPGQITFSDDVNGWTTDDIVDIMRETGMAIDFDLADAVFDRMDAKWDSGVSMSGYEQVVYFIDQVAREMEGRDEDID